MKKIITLVLVVISVLILFFLKNNNVYVKKSKVSDSIISLSPSLTRQVIDLGVENRLIGVTSYHPPLNKKVEIIGSIVRPDFEKIFMLQPELVLVSEEDSVTQNTERLSGSSINVIKFSRNSDFKSLRNNYLKLGGIIGREELAQKKIDYYSGMLKKLRKQKKADIKTIFLVSTDPLISVSGKSYISSIMSDAGAENVFRDLKIPYPKISFEALIYSNAEVIVIMTEKVSLNEKRVSNKILKFRKDLHKKIRFIKPDHVGFYTPYDYVESVIHLRELLLL